MPTLIGKVSTLQKVYNPDTMSWDAMRQPSTAAGGASTVVASTQVAVSNFPATQPVSGTVAVSNFVAPSTQITVSNYSTQVSIGNTVPVTVAGVMDVTPLVPTAIDYLPVRLTDGEAFTAPSTQVSVSGYVAPSTTVSVANWPATQPVSGTVTVAGYVTPSTQVSVSGYVAPSTTVAVSNFPATQAVSGTVSVSGYSTQVTVSGYVAPSTVVTVSNFVAPSTTVAVSSIAGKVRGWTPDSTTASGQAAAAGDNTLFSSAATSIFVYAYCLSPISTGAQLARFLNGSTNEQWRVRTLGGSTVGIQNSLSQLAVTPPAYLFRTAAGNPLVLNVASSGVNYAVSAWRE